MSKSHFRNTYVPQAPQKSRAEYIMYIARAIVNFEIIKRRVKVNYIGQRHLPRLFVYDVWHYY